MKQQDRVVIHLPEEYHQTLMRMAFKRSEELGTRVSMGFIIREMMDRDQQLQNRSQRTADLFAAHD
jgi:hypothetical protein